MCQGWQRVWGAQGACRWGLGSRTAPPQAAPGLKVEETGGHRSSREAEEEEALRAGSAVSCAGPGLRRVRRGEDEAGRLGRTPSS